MAVARQSVRFAAASMLWSPFAWGQDGELGATTTWAIAAGVAVVIILILGVLAAWLYALQRQFVRMCREAVAPASMPSLELFAKSPFGVPVGSVRALLAMSIVFGSVAYMAVTVATGEEFPQILVGLLGTVLGFYFGSRSAGDSGSAEAYEEVGVAKRQRDLVIEDSKRSELGQVIDKGKSWLGVGRAVATVLPKELRGKVEGVLGTADGLLGQADNLRRGGDTTDALQRASEALASVGPQDNPLADTLRRALASFGLVLGSSLPATAVITVAVLGVSRLTGTAYDRWKARVLNAPYSAELFPPTVVDSALAMSLIRRSPLMADAYAEELNRGDNAALKVLAQMALQEDADDALWRLPDTVARFEDREAFEAALAQFQRIAIAWELEKDLDAPITEATGGFEPFLEAVDRLHADRTALRDLDAIVLIADQLKNEGRDVMPAFDEALTEAKHDEAKR